MPATGGRDRRRWRAGQFGTPGAPLNRRSPFYIGFVGGVGVLVAYGLVQSLARLSQVLTLLAVALFLALGLDPIVRWLQRRGLGRGWAVLVVFVVVISAFVGLLLVLRASVDRPGHPAGQQRPDVRAEPVAQQDRFAISTTTTT